MILILRFIQTYWIIPADPESDFMSLPGELNLLLLPQYPGVSVDIILYPGCLMPPFYDFLICKLSIGTRIAPPSSGVRSVL